MEDMTGLQQFNLSALIADGSVAHLADAYYTSKGLAKGFKEANPVSAWLFKKIGFALTVFLSGALFIFAALLLSMLTAVGSIVFAGAITALETYMAIRNKKLLT